MRTISVADYFVEFLIANEVTDVFGYQGGMIAYIFDSLGKYRDKIKYHSCATEQGAALAACAYAQASKKIGVAISTSGPGFTNLVTGIANAWFDSIPVLFVSGNVNTKDKKRDMPLRQLGFQEIQAAKVAEAITKKVYEVELETDYVNCFNEAYKTAMTNRKGPVFIDLPINVCREQVEVGDICPVAVQVNDVLDVNSLLEDIKNSVRPVIIAGAGIKQSDCVDEFREVITRLEVPVVTTLPAVDVLPTNSKSMMGYIGGTARREAGIVLQNADYVLSIGTRLCSKQIGHNHSLFAPKAQKFVRIDIDDKEFCRQLTENEVDLKADIKKIITQMRDKLKEENYQRENTTWVDACSQIKELLQNSDMTEGNEIIQKVTNLLNNDANILLDVGKNLTYGGQSGIVKQQTKVYMSAGLGTMGYSIPAAMGAFLGNKKPTYAITGDGGAQMNIQELNTIVKNRLPIKVIVLNNRALGNIRIFQEQYLESRFVATSEAENDYFSCNFGAVATAYGMKSYSINCIDEIDKYADEFTSNESALFEINYEDCPALPGIVAGGDFLKEGTGISDDIIKKIKSLLE